MVNIVLRLSFKVLNSFMGLAGIATIFYAIFIFRLFQIQTSSSPHIPIPIPWFFHGLLFVGIVLCAVTCLGHLAANTANTCCLYTYIAIIILLLILEIVIITDAFLNPKVEKELPVEICKSLATMVFLVQAVCLFLAALSILDHNTDEVNGYASNYEDEQTRFGLLYPFAQWQYQGSYIV